MLCNTNDIPATIHRQHPGESMAEFYAEGPLGRLLGESTRAVKIQDGIVTETSACANA